MKPSQACSRYAIDNRPRVSVIIPCYNHGCYIHETVASVRSQTFTECEVIIVDDGSTDPATLDILARLDGNGCRVIHTLNRGPASARNTGIAASRGEYILPLDADDRISPDFVRKAVNLLDDDYCLGIVYSKVCFFGDASGVWLKPKFSPGRLLIENMIVASAVFRRDDWLSVGGYKDVMKEGWEDWDFWLSLLEMSRKVYYLENEIFYYRIRQESRTRSLPLSVKVRLFILMILNHKALYFINMPKILQCIPAWIRDGRGRT